MLPLNFVGYVEGHDLFSDRVEVVVTDGFVGNILLKTIESMGKSIVRLLRRELTANPVRKLGGVLAKGGLQSIKNRMNPDTYGGAPLLGLNGVVIKAHGSANPRAIMNAIHFATEAIQHHVNEITARQVAEAHERLTTLQSPIPA
jgi:glycerol-3-phosphate acyltransferase PlsX